MTIEHALFMVTKLWRFKIFVILAFFIYSYISQLKGYCIGKIGEINFWELGDWAKK